jgi:cytochrome bd ubiquinol oxidase subunit II
MTLSFLLQGIYVQGMYAVNRQYAGGWLDWLDAFTARCGIALVVGYALQGVCWLILRTGGRLLHSARRYASTLGLALLGLIFVISLWTPMLNDVYWKHWFIYPQVLFTAPMPILVVLVAGHSGARSGGITT